MWDLHTHWSAEIARRPIVLVPLVALLITVVMNARTGYRLGNESLEIAVVCVAIALATAYAGTTVWALDWRREPARKSGLIVLLLFGLAVDQLAGWQTLGLSFADGQASRNARALTGATRTEHLEDLKRQRRQAGTVRAIATIEAFERHECSKTSARYPDGVGPECTKLRAEKETARRAAELDREIATATEDMDGREQVAAGQPQFAVPQALAQGALTAMYGPKARRVTADDVLWWVMVLLVAIVGLMANLGFWLVGSSHGSGTVAAQSADDGWQPPRHLLPPRRAALTYDPGAAGGGEGTTGGGGSAGGASVSTPIHITVGGPAAGPAAAPAAAPGAVTTTADAAPATVSGGILTPSRVREASSTPAAPDVPVVRSPINNAVDRIVTFKAGCLLDAGQHDLLPIADAYDRYRTWAQGRAVSPAAFQALLEASGSTLTAVAGEMHLVGVRLREARPRLVAVGA